MRRSRVLIPLAFALLLVAWLLSSRCATDAVTGPDGGPLASVESDEARRVVFPRNRPPPKRPAQPKDKDNRTSRDRLTDALSAEGADTALFVEVNAIRHSALVEAVLECLSEQGRMPGEIQKLKQRLGIDPLEDIDRLGVSNGVTVMSGFLNSLQVPPSTLGRNVSTADGARVDALVDETGAETGFLGRVGDELVLVGEDEAAVRQAVLRAQGLAPAAAGPSPLSSRTEVYGTVGKEMLAGLVGLVPDAATQGLLALVQNAQVQVAFDDSVALSIDLQTPDEATASDLGKALGGALALARRQAETDGDKAWADLLSQSRVLPDRDGRFSVDLAVPGDRVLQQLGCPPLSGATADGGTAP